MSWTTYFTALPPTLRSNGGSSGNQLDERDRKRHDEENVNEAAECVRSYQPQKPQDQQNYENRPKHTFFLTYCSARDFCSFTQQLGFHSAFSGALQWNDTPYRFGGGTLRIGIHTSISVSLEHAALKAAELGANTFQIFSTSPRMWRASAPPADTIARLRRARRKIDLRPLVVHANYLINLAAADHSVRAKSIAAFRSELERSEAIGAEYVVLHPGSCRGSSLPEGIASVALGLEAAAKGLGRLRVTVLLENTVGCGAQIGCRFEELRAVRDLVLQLADLRIGYCLDTCHLLAAGYNIATAEGLEHTVGEAERILGLRNVKVIHTNDSKTPLGSRVDRHENIGEGYIGNAGFRRILAHPKLRSKPFLLETPYEDEGDDRRNLENLKKLCPKSHTTITRSS